MDQECKIDGPVWALGLMSGTSLDGIDAALIRTDGHRIHAHGPNLTQPYDDADRALLFACLKGKGDEAEASRMLALRHAEAVEALLTRANLRAEDVCVLGFHGQTIRHAPEQGITHQIGDAALLARRTRIATVADFRSNDVRHGGQGAPLVPLYHAALAANLPRPIAIVNIGGVANITWIGEGENNITAFDTGPGNALLDDWVRDHTGAHFDENGQLSAAGALDEAILERFLEHNYFQAPPPKSLDRNGFSAFARALVSNLSVEDGAATLLHFTAASIAAAAARLPSAPHQWLIAGGGRHNHTLMQLLRSYLPNVSPIESSGFNGDALEAEAFAYLAVRSLLGMPLSLPATTGVKQPTTGGTLYTPSAPAPYGGHAPV